MRVDGAADAVAPARPAAAPARPAAAPDAEASGDSRRIAKLASEFEAMLLGQMLREMRQAGSWKDDSDSEGMDNQALFDAIDTELALRLAQAQPLGLGNQLVREITRGAQANPTAAPAAFPLHAPATAMPLTPVSFAGTPYGVPGSPEAPSIASPRATGVAVDVTTAMTSQAATGGVTSGFGWRQDPLTGVPAFHKGIDVRASYGETVAAAGPGRVVVARSQGGYGQTVVVDHGGGLQTRYAHLSALSVGVGDTVEAGAAVGRAGRSGRATGTHVHFEATQGGQPVDPAEFSARLKAATGVADVGTGRTD